MVIHSSTPCFCAFHLGFGLGKPACLHFFLIKTVLIIAIGIVVSLLMGTGGLGLSGNSIVFGAWNAAPWNADARDISLSPSTVFAGDSARIKAEFRNTSDNGAATFDVAIVVYRPTGTGTRFYWDNTSFTANQVKTYTTTQYNFNQAGTYTIHAEIYDISGYQGGWNQDNRFDRYIEKFTIANPSHPPSVSRVSPLSPVSLDTGDRQTFRARASDPDDNLKRYEWFVNGRSEDSGVWRLFLPTGSVTKDFSHRFSTAGNYTVKATFTDTEGESDFTEWTVTVIDPNRAPSVSRVSPSSPVSLDTDDRQTFRARASDPDDNLKRYEWFVNGRSEDSGVWRLFLPTGSVTKDFSHRFPTAGNYTVKATFTDTEGESDSTEWTVTVKDPNRAPSVVRGSPSTESVSLETGDRQAFTANASDPDNNLRGYEWFVGDVFGDAFVWQTPPTGFASGTFSHTFSTEGTFIVEASFTDTEGESDFTEWTVTVIDPNRAPSVSRVSPSSPVSLDTDDRQTFRARASDPDDNLKRYEWFVNGRSEDSGVWRLFLPTGSVTKDFSHRFSTAGNYTVKATFTDTEGESDFTEWTVTVKGPNRAPSVDRVSPTQESLSLETGDSQSFTVRATDADNDLTKWQWVADWHGVALPHLDPGHTEPEASFALTGDIPKTFSYTFDTAGTWTVTVTFTDSRGESGSVAWEVTVTDPVPETVTVTINSNLIGLTVMVDGTDRTTPYTADWTSGSSHTLNVPSPQTVSQSAYVFSSWSDGLARSHSVSPTTDTTYTANFTLTTAGGDGRAEITSCGSDPASPTVKDEWAPVATVTNHSYSGRQSKKLYVEFTISDPTRGLALPETKSTTQTWIEVGESGTFVGPAASWPKELKEKPTEREAIEDTRQLSLLKLKWFPGEIFVECELKANVTIWWDEELDTDDTGRVTISPLQGGSAATITALNEATTCAPARRPVLSGEAPTLQAKTRPIRRNSDGVTQLAVEYWVYRDGQRVHHDGYGWAWSRSGEKTASVNWVNDQPLPLGQYRLDCALWGHRVSPAYEPLGGSSKTFEVFLKWLQNFLDWDSDPAGVIKRLKEAGGLPTTSNVQKLEREYVLFDYALQGLVSTEFSVVEARWGTAGLSIELGTETPPEGRERIRVRVNREETKGRPRPITAPYFHIKGPELEQIEQAISCAEGDQNHTTYLLLCWETTFDIPVNDTKNAREYTVKAKSFFIDHDLAGSFTVEAAQDAVGLMAFYEATGGPNWSNKNGWLSNDPIGDWYGVDTDTRGRVVKLDLRGSDRRGSGLQGRLPANLKVTLPFLQTLYLEGNNGLTKCIPEDLFYVQTNDLKLASLNLPTCEDTCAWGGALPDPNNQGLVADCEALLAARDTLTAGQPSGRLNWSAREHIGTWRGVVREGNPERVIRLEIEQPPLLWGYISREIAKLSGLQVLTLANAGLRGEIPEELKDLASLNTLNLQGNQLNGGIPRELSGLTSLHTLDLSDNELDGGIPERLTRLVNLQTLRLDGNQFSGCIPEGLRGVASNDLASLGLPFCDVLLSGLTISPGVLTPRFEYGRTDYTAEVGVSRITVTPTNSHNATFMFLFLDENDAPIPDADGTLVGHQVELGNGVTTIGVKVLSQDAGASHTYTIQVSRGGSLPDAPAIVVPITPGAASLMVSWTAPPGETGITSYDLRYIESGSQPDANWTVVESVWTSGSGSPNYRITGLANGTQYNVQVRTVNAAGHGFWSASATGTPRTTPGSPAIDSLGPGDSTLAVEWSAPATDGGAEVAGYDLRFIRSDAPDKADANWTGRNNIWSSGTLRYDLGGLTNGVSYDVLVRTVNAVGHGPWSPAATGTPRTTPGAPVIDSLIPGDGALNVGWSDPATDGGAEVTGYDQRHIESGAADKADANWTGRNNIWSSGALRYDLGGLTNGVSYDVLVRAVNAVGHGPWSPAATGTPRTTPGAPVIDSLIPGGGALNVGWSDPATDGGAEVTGYDLRFIRSDAPDKADANWTGRSGIWSSGPLRYDLGGLTDGVGYDVQVRAANAAGRGQWSGSITVTPHTMPTAPAIVSVDAGDGALIISWTEPADIGGLNIQGYDVRYIPAEENNPGATWTEEQDVWTLGSLEHTITGLTNGVRYDLELRALTSAGDGPWSSAFSATPKTTPDVPIISLITPDGSTLTVAWDAPANTGGSAITSYDLRYIESGAIDKADANWTEVVPAWSTGPLSYAFGSLTGGTPYDVQVRAVNASGPGLWSATFAGTPVTIRASRSFSPTPVSAGGELEVTITAAGYGGFGGVVETLPIGFSYVSSSLSDSAVTVAGQEVSFTLVGETAFTYTVAAPSAEGTYSFSGVLKNSNRVEQPVGGVSSITVEAGALSVSITRSATTLMRIGLAIPVTAVFSKPVSGFAVEDVSVTNGGVSNFAGSGRDYAFDVTPNAIGKVTVDIAAGAATDAGGNGNAAAGQLALGIPYDDDGNWAIGKSEVVTAINDYLFGEGDEAISKSDVITLINLYLFG